MTTATLTIQYGPRRLRETRAWYLPGGDAESWVREIAGWNVSHVGVRLYPVPRARGDLRARGVLVIAPDAARAEVSPRCVPYGGVADRLFLPVEAGFDPDVGQAELRGLLSPEYTYVWHPGAGLVAFPPSDALTLADLVRPGPARDGRWDGAKTGVGFSRRLTAIAPTECPKCELILKQGRDDIGAKGDPEAELPPSPNEPRTDPLSTAARYGRRALAGIVGWIARHMPAGSGRDSWVRRAEQWAEKSLAGFQAALSASRNRAIARLLHLLETDPDRGLRFALSLWKRPHRGVAPPGDRLVERDVDFNLRRLGGGGPADVWSASAEYHFRLMARYRELANREIRLGRYRRAAYILGELLGDLYAAASALAQGKHWREAAVLYRDQLHRPGDAARCLEQGGLWTEAIALYEEVGQYETAGELLLKLEQPDRACESFRKAVTQHRDRGDFVSAARILDERLDEPDEAIGELEKGWPATPQAGQCLRGVLRLLGRLGRHEATRDRVAELRTSTLPSHTELDLVDILAETAGAYPDRDVRHAAADSTRAIVSRGLPGASTSAASRLLGAIRRLVPEDRLLGRDCDRFFQQQVAPPIRPAPVRRLAGKRLTLAQTIRIPGEVTWSRMVLSGRTIYAAGFLARHLVLARCNWSGRVDRAIKPWRVDPRLTAAPMILSADPLREDHLLVHVVTSSTPLEERVFPATDQFPSEVRAGSLWTVPGVVGAARTTHGFTWLVVLRDRYTLMNLGPRGGVIATETLPFLDPDIVPDPDRWRADDDASLEMPVPLHARGNTVYIGLAEKMLVYRRAGEPEIVEFSHPIVSLAGSAPNTRTRIAAGFIRGGAVYWDDFEVSRTESFSSDLWRPVVGFNRGGYLIAADSLAAEVYATQGRRLERIGKLGVPRSNPIAVLPGPRTDQFAIATAKGEIAVYEIR